VLQLVAVGALFIVASGALTARRLFDTAGDAVTDGGRSVDRARFMAGLGLLFAALFTMLVLCTAVPSWILHACE
jgi:hypothetical protein